MSFKRQQALHQSHYPSALLLLPLSNTKWEAGREEVSSFFADVVSTLSLAVCQSLWAKTKSIHIDDAIEWMEVSCLTEQTNGLVFSLAANPSLTELSYGQAKMA